DIDLVACKFNSILFSKIVDLHFELLRELKCDPDIWARRAVTLAYTKGKGPLADAIFGDSASIAEEIILDASGVTYVSPVHVSIFDRDDYDIVRRILAVAKERGRTVVLPERWIAESAQALLQSLTEHCGKDWKSKFIERHESDVSILEEAAKSLR